MTTLRRSSRLSSKIEPKSNNQVNNQVKSNNQPKRETRKKKSTENPKMNEIDKYISDKLKKPVKRSYDLSKPDEARVAILMVGMPGSGKTGTKEICCKNYPFEFVNIDPDEFLEKFYENDRKHYPKAFKHANKLLDRTIEEKRSLILDGTGVNLFKNIQRLHNENYYISLCINLLDKETCKIQAQSRFEKTGRAPDFKYIDIVHSKHKINIPLYLESDMVDDAFIYVNERSGRRRLICTKRFGNCYIDKINMYY
jgi:predicted ABC-type ATPase